MTQHQLKERIVECFIAAVSFAIETRDGATDASRGSPWANDWNFIALAM